MHRATELLSESHNILQKVLDGQLMPLNKDNEAVLRLLLKIEMFLDETGREQLAETSLTKKDNMDRLQNAIDAVLKQIP